MVVPVHPCGRLNCWVLPHGAAVLQVASYPWAKVGQRTPTLSHRRENIPRYGSGQFVRLTPNK